MRSNLEDNSTNKKSHRWLLGAALLLSGMIVGAVSCFLAMQKYEHVDDIESQFSSQYYASEAIYPESANSDIPAIPVKKTSSLTLDSKQLISGRECNENPMEGAVETSAPDYIVQNDKKKSSAVSVYTDTKDLDNAKDLQKTEISQKNLTVSDCVTQTKQGVDLDSIKEVNTHKKTTCKNESSAINIKICDNDTKATDLNVNQIVEPSNVADYVGPLDSFLGANIDEIRPLFPSFELEDYGNNGLMWRDYWLSVQFWYNSERRINLIIIEDSNPAYSILGVHTGMDWKEAETILRSQGFDFALEPNIRYWVRPDQCHELEISVIDGKVVWFSYMML